MGIETGKRVNGVFRSLLYFIILFFSSAGSPQPSSPFEHPCVLQHQILHAKDYGPTQKAVLRPHHEALAAPGRHRLVEHERRAAST